MPAVSTSTLLLSLLQSASGDIEHLLRETVRVAAARNYSNILSDVLARDDVPTDLLRELLDYPDTTVRTAAVRSPSASTQLRVAAINATPSVHLLNELADSLTDPAGLRAIADRALASPQKARRRLLAGLLKNAALPADDRRAVLIAAVDGEPDLTALAPVLRDLTRQHPQAAAAIADQLTHPVLLSIVITGAAAALTGPQWARLLERALEQSPAPGSPGRLLWAQLLLHICLSPNAPVTVAAPLVQTLRRHYRDALPAEKVLQATTMHRAHLHGQRLLATAATASREALAREFDLSSLTPAIARELLRNPNLNVEQLPRVVVAAGLDPAGVRDLLGRRAGVADRVAACFVLGPDSMAALAAVEDEDDARWSVLAGVFDRVATHGGKFAHRAAADAWRAHLDEVPGQRLVSLSWQTLRLLLTSRQRDWLATQLAEVFAQDGAAELFSELDTVFSGSTAELLATLRQVTAPASGTGHATSLRPAAGHAR